MDNDFDQDVVVSAWFWYENLESGVFGDANIISSINARDVCVADIDGDTYNDVISCDWENLYWFRNKQDGTFELGQKIPGNPPGYYRPPSSVNSADISGDGHNDLISVFESPDPGLTIAINQGNGQFGPFSGFWSSVGVVYPVDLDDDDDIDLIAVDFDLIFFENINGSIYNVGVLNEDHPNGVFPADIDNDGDLDIVGAGGHYTKPAWVGWYENNGSTQFQTFHTILEVDSAYGTKYLFVCDLDNDNDQDIVCAFWDWNLLGWFENDGNGVFGDLITISTDLIKPKSVYCADFDNDGDKDVLAWAASYLDHRVVWFENDLDMGLEKIDEDINFQIYPNPTQGALYVSSEKDITGTHIMIYNIAGQIIKQSDFNGHSVSVYDLENGMYFLRIVTDQGVISRKFIVNG
jgi:hypothetical protein